MKKITFLIFGIFFIANYSFAQVAINTNGADPDPSAILDISSTDKGVLIPRVTTAERNLIGTTQSGLLVYDTDTESFWYYDNTQAGWVEMVVDGNLDIDGLSDAKTDTRSVFLGNRSGDNDDGSNYNTATGVFAAENNTSGTNNSFYGYSSGQYTTTGTNNTLIGENAGRYNTTGSKNTIVGSKANYTVQTGSNNTIIGYEAGRGTVVHNKSGNILIGFQAGYNETGDNKLYIDNSSTTTPLIGGDFSTNELYINGSIKITGGSPGANKVLTSDADGNATWEDNDAASEINGLSDGITDASNLFLGDYTGTQDDGDNSNTGVGINSLYWNTSGSLNSSYGFKSSYRNTSGSSNTVLGSYALYFNTTRSNNVAVGDSAMYYNGNNFSSSPESEKNTAIGSRSLLNNNTGYYNTSVGYKSLYENTTGNRNTGLGFAASLDNTTGDYNLTAGAYAGAVNTTGSSNVSLGYGADYYNNGGSNNVAIGYSAGRGSTGNNKSGNIFIGYKAGYSETGSNKLYIHNSESTSPLIYGDFSSSQLEINGMLDVETINPASQLRLLGSSTLSSFLVAPQGSSQNDSEILLAEDDNFTYGISLKYDGGDNRLYFYGKDSQDTLGSHLTIERDGNIGIGTSAPIGNFHIHDPNNQHNIVYITPKSTSGDSSSVFFAEDNNAETGMYWMYDGTNNRIGLWGETSYGGPYGPHMLIYRNTGNMAIGGENFATGYKLSVEGKVMCEEIRVSLQENWPDYVFANDYNLMPINEFRKFIEKYKHLPNIPDAQNIEDSGVELGEMQRLLLEKIEELSLYILEQDERIKNLEDQLK